MAASQAAKAALGLKRYQKPVPQPFNRDTTEQLNEYYGISHFHCKLHEQLAKSLVSISSAYKTSPTVERQKLAGEEIKAWENYLEEREKELPGEFKIPENTHARLQRIWSQMLHREKDSIEYSRMLDFHTKFTEHYRFDVPLDKRSMFEMVHPHAGYMTLLPGALTFDRLIWFYRNQIVASYERSLGEDLLSRQISCFNYYRVVLGEAQWLDKKKTAEMMNTLRFPKLELLSQLKSTFEWTLKDFENEFDGMKEDEFFVRFALVRKIFLDFNL